MPILIVAAGVLLLLLLMLKFKLNTFISLVIVSIGVGMALGIPIDKIVKSVEGGMGSTLGHLSLVFGFGAMLGKLVADAGGAYKISTTLINKFGKKRVQLAVVITSFIVGIALFFEVGIVLLLPIIFAMAAELSVPILYIGMPMMAALSVTHGFLPPHPAPTAISAAYNANLSMVLIYGLLIGIPTTIVAGPLYTKFISKFPKTFNRKASTEVYSSEENYDKSNLPGFGVSVMTALLPVILMAAASAVTIIFPYSFPGKKLISFIGDPDITLLISVIVAIYTMGFARGKKVDAIMKTITVSISEIAMMLLIIGGGGAFKQVLIDGGVGQYVATLATGSNLSPIVLAWLVAGIIRICVGSATVAALTTAGIVSPLMVATNTSPELMVIATGAGSVIFSHVNDVGFWMFKEYFGLSIKETFATWSVLETLIAIMGLVGVLALNIFI